MTENQTTAPSPASVLKRELGSKKILAIAIILSLQAVAMIVNKISNRTDFSSTIDMLANWLSMDLTAISNAAGVLSTIILILSLISVVPLVILTIGFWFVFVGGKSPDKAAYVAKGVNLIHIYAVISLLLFLLSALGSVIVIVVVGIICMKANVTTGLIVLFVGLLIAAGIIAFFYMYTLKIVKICFGVKYTLKTDNNMLYVYTFVVVWFWIKGICGILSGFGSFIGFLSAALSASVYIMLALTLNKYKKEVGVPTTAFVNEQFKLYRKSPKTYNPDVAEGYTDEFATAQNTTAGAPKQQAYTTPVNNFNRAAPQNKTPIVAAGIAMNTVVSPIHAVSTETLPKSEATVIKVFPTDNGTLNARFSLLGDKVFAPHDPHEKCPIAANRAEILSDALSERKILRLSLTNASGAEIKSVAIEIYAAANDNSVLAYMPEVNFDVASVQNGENFLAEYGVILPDEATNGFIRIAKVTFSDGLYWDKGSEPLVFSTKEKYEYDVNIFLALTSN